MAGDDQLPRLPLSAPVRTANGCVECSWPSDGRRSSNRRPVHLLGPLSVRQTTTCLHLVRCRTPGGVSAMPEFAPTGRPQECGTPVFRDAIDVVSIKIWRAHLLHYCARPAGGRFAVKRSREEQAGCLRQRHSRHQEHLFVGGQNQQRFCKGAPHSFAAVPRRGVHSFAHLTSPAAAACLCYCLLPYLAPSTSCALQPHRALPRNCS